MPRERLRHWAEIGLAATCFVMPLHGRLVAPILILAIIALLLSLQKRKLGPPHAVLWFPIGYYLLFVLGMVRSQDIAFGLFDLEIKASLLLLPPILWWARPFSAAMLRRCMLAMTAGLLLAFFIGWFYSFHCYSIHKDPVCFTTSRLSNFIHPSYQAWYAVWVLGYWGFQLLRGRSVASKRRTLMIGSLALLVYVVMLTSKTGWIGIVLLLFMLLAIAFRELPKRARRIALYTSLGLLLLPAVFLRGIVEERAADVVDVVALVNEQGVEAVTHMNSSTGDRLVAWSCSKRLIEANPWGVGTGDVKNELMALYHRIDAVYAIERRLNSHSQLLQSGVALGWPGMIFFMFWLLVPLIYAWYRRDVLLLLFCLLFIVNSLVESVLEVQAGVVFVAMFLPILIAREPYRYIE